MKTDLVEVQHDLSVSLRFGMGRSLKKQVPVHIHQLDAGCVPSLPVVRVLLPPKRPIPFNAVHLCFALTGPNSI